MLPADLPSASLAARPYFRFVVALFAVACSLVASSCSAVTDCLGEFCQDHNPAPDPGPPPSATLVWSDEFDGTELDTTRWEYRSLGPRRDAVNVRDAVKLDGEGHLLITTSRNGDVFETGMIGTEPTFTRTYGYWEARMRFQREEGHWAAFWLQSPTVSEVGNPAENGVEIDIIEYLRIEGDRVRHTLHWDGYGDDHKQLGKRLDFPGLGEGFHTVAVYWTPTSYTFYVDGVETWHTTYAISHRDQYAILSLEVGDWAGDIASAFLPDTLVVDYVRVYETAP